MCFEYVWIFLLPLFFTSVCTYIINRIDDFFIKEATLKNEDDTPPDISQLDCQLDEAVLSIKEVKKKKVIKNLHNRLLIAAAHVISEPLTH